MYAILSPWLPLLLLVLCVLLRKNLRVPLLARVLHVPQRSLLKNLVVPGLIAASIFIGLMGIMGLLSFFASELVSSLSFGFINVSSVGLLFVGLSFAGVVLSYSVMLIYLAVLKGLKPMTLTGIPFVAFVFLPVFDMVPGLNIFPWLILWAFLLCTVPQK